jgi:tetratricopeptide (TPR) repeat protein
MKSPPPVRAWVDVVTLPTYLPASPDKNPMLLEKRVYQGSNGKVYPLPFTDRIAETPVDRQWKAIWIENEFLRAMVLPELGGRIHILQDKATGYDLIYNQQVIKPALVGLAGPWISGGIEFNWPQHHRPGTFLPVDFKIEEHSDGSKTIWCSDHDPMCRMKGMHGISLHPGRAYLELKVRAYNRTPLTQTFLWWANVAARVHEGYQSFFPPDVYYVADHARRSMSEYPHAKGFYYGVNYGDRERNGVPQNQRPLQFLPPHCAGRSKPEIPDYAPNDLSFYANIPVPTSYMCMGSREDFFGGYDYKAHAGIVHIANHHISPGKKQWTWGNHEFGYAWDRNLTDQDARGEFGPYIEIMAGVYTDNQPDFSFLQPGETKTWSQYWYPIQKIGPVQKANMDAAASLTSCRDDSRAISIGLSVTRTFRRAKIVLSAKGKNLLAETRELAPDAPFTKRVRLTNGLKLTDLVLRVADPEGNEIISYKPKPRVQGKVPPPATEPRMPEAMDSSDELFITGLHLEQYRHATRCPTLYWREALRRDAGDARCNNALGLWHVRRGEFTEAEPFFRRAIARLTLCNANPADGEPHYNLGLCLRHLGRDDDAYDEFYKSVWNQAWMAAGYHALAEIDCSRGAWSVAGEHLNRSLRFDTDNLRARNLNVIVLRRLGRTEAAETFLKETRMLDPLDWWSRQLAGEKLLCDLQTALDLAHDYARAGLFPEAIELLESRIAIGSGSINETTALPDQSWGTLPLVHYTLGWLQEKNGGRRSALRHFKAAARVSPDYCFPSRLEEITVLKTAMQLNAKDARAPYYLGNLLYDRRRHEEAIQCWEKSARMNGRFSVVWRNLGIGYLNVRHDARGARMAYDRAFRANPSDARLLFERDQLWKRLKESPEKRLRELEKHRELVAQRDDLSVELCALYNQTAQPEEALKIISTRAFQPWEGGEGQALGQHVRTHLALGRAALAQNDFLRARRHFEQALKSPENLGEGKHLLANQSDIHYWLGMAIERLGDQRSARKHWLAAATFRGDFQEMRVRAFSEMTYHSARSWEKLGKKKKAQKLFRDLLAYAKKLKRTTAKMEYFATSLPAMLLFEDDLQLRQTISAIFLQAQAEFGLGNKIGARVLLKTVLRHDPNHSLATELLNDINETRAVRRKRSTTARQ